MRQPKPVRLDKAIRQIRKDIDALVRQGVVTRAEAAKARRHHDRDPFYSSVTDLFDAVGVDLWERMGAQ